MPRNKKAHQKKNRKHKIQRKQNLFRSPSNYANLVYSVTESIEASPRSGTDYNVYAFTLNGYGALGTTLEVPQENIWNQQAAIYSLYTIRAIEVEWIPYLFNFSVNAGANQTVRYFPSVFLQDHDGQPPINFNDYLAHGHSVFSIRPGQERHTRKITNPQKLLLQIENKEYYETNSTWSSRETIPSAPGLFARVVHPSIESEYKFGMFVVRYIYAFSSRHDVGEELEHLDVEDPAIWEKREKSTVTKQPQSEQGCKDDYTSADNQKILDMISQLSKK